MDDLDFDPGNGGLGVAISADSETWLPCIVLAIPLDDDDDFAAVMMTGEEAIRVGSALVNIGLEVTTLHSSLLPKTVDERREIILMEEQFLGPSKEPGDATGR